MRKDIDRRNGNNIVDNCQIETTEHVNQSDRIDDDDQAPLLQVESGIMEAPPTTTTEIFGFDL